MFLLFIGFAAQNFLFLKQSSNLSYLSEKYTMLLNLCQRRHLQFLIFPVPLKNKCDGVSMIVLCGQWVCACGLKISLNSYFKTNLANFCFNTLNILNWAYWTYTGYGVNILLHKNVFHNCSLIFTMIGWQTSHLRINVTIDFSSSMC